jgi:putative cell wall teichoic acid glycosylation protein gtcA
MNRDKFLELLRYIIIGILTTLLNILIYYICTNVLSIHYVMSTIIAWIMAVIFSFFTNRDFVFKNKKSKTSFFKEFNMFWTTRYLTGLLDVGMMFLGVNIFKQNDTEIKIFSNIVGTILNYIITKYLVFR